MVAMMTNLRGTPLRDSDYEGLLQSWIDRESADKALLRRVTSIEGAEIVGQKDGHNYSGVIFPNSWPGEGHVREYRLRRDSPDIRYDNKGIAKPDRKYLSPPGAPNMLYFVPDTPAAWLDDPDLPIVITEGEKKTIALARLAWFEASDASERPHFLPIGLAGVWNWQGKIGMVGGPHGQRVNVKGVIPDLGRIRFTDRKVIIAYDSDTKTNESVRAARLELARHLIHERGAQVHFAELPAIGENKKTGIDDLLATAGPAKVLKIIERAKQTRVREKATPQTAILGRIHEEADFFHTQDGRPFATVAVNGHQETWPTRSQGFRNWLTRKFYLEENKPPSTQALQEALGVCDARAQFDGPVYEVGVRLMGDERNVFLDLANDAWQAIEINPSTWRPTSTPPVKFRRARGMAALPNPVMGNISELRRFVNAPDDQNWILIVAWLLSTLNPRGPYPILILQGEQGSGKSTVARVLRRLIDPSTAPLRSAPRDERDLMIAATNSWVISLDNLSGIQPWLSDALCRLSTGGGFATRELHTDSEEILFDATRPIILNGIDDIAGNADLADRAVVVTLPQVREDERIAERDFWQEFDLARPGILGALLEAASTAIRNAENVKTPRLPRMADFARWICAAAPALPFTQEAFFQAYSDNRKESVSLSIEASPLAAGILTLTAPEDWEGTATALLQVLSQRVPEDTRKAKVWPKDARTMSSKLRRIAPLLRSVGVDVEWRTEGHEKRKIIAITRKTTRTTARSDRIQVPCNENNEIHAF